MRLGMLCGVTRHLQLGYHGITQRATTRLLPAASFQAKHFSSDIPEPYKFLNVKSDVQKGVSVMEMKKKPVNSLSLEFLTEVNIALEKFENDKSLRGVIVTSAAPVFCAGLDILEMYQPQEDRLRTFWYNVQEMAIRAFSLPKVMISAIDGACIAGGCILAWGSDYSVMSEGKHTIGLNETQLGLSAPPWLANLAVRTMGIKNAEKMLQRGELYTPQQALSLGAVDETCHPGKALDVAMERMQEWLRVADSGRLVTKQMLRQEFVDELQKRREQDIDTFCSMVTLDSTQNLLGKYVEALKSKTKK